MVDRLRRALSRSTTPQYSTSFGSWDGLTSATVVACHPNWRGVRTASYAFGEPVIEAVDFAPFATEIAGHLTETAVQTIVVSGFPSGSTDLIRACRRAGLETRLLLHSSMAQHGADPVEAEVMEQALSLLADGFVCRLGLVKAGLAEAFRALGHEAQWVPIPVPTLPPIERMELAGEPSVGVFAEPFWRKNVVTQLAAVALLPRSVGHVMRMPAVAYLQSVPVVEHGELPWDLFIQVQSSVDLNLYVTLSECQPLTPVESYLAGVPCLMAPTSVLFRSDPELWRLTTVEEIDNPAAIASAANRLLAAGGEAVERARAWMTGFDAEARRAWRDFTGLGDRPFG